MKKILLLMLMLSALCLNISPLKSTGEAITYTSISEAVLAKSVECNAIYWNWFHIKVVLKRKSPFVKGISIVPGDLFESSKGTASRICVEKMNLPFDKKGYITAIIAALAISEGNFKGIAKEKLTLSRKQMTLSRFKRYVCNTICTNTLFPLECGQVALWLENKDPDYHDISRWVIGSSLFPSAGTKLFDPKEIYRGLYLAHKGGLNIEKKSLSKQVSMFLYGIRDEKPEILKFCMDRLRKLGYRGSTPVEMALTLMNTNDQLFIIAAAVTLLNLKKYKLVEKRIKSLVGVRNPTCCKVVKRYLVYVPSKDGIALMRFLLDKSYFAYCAEANYFVQRLKDSFETLSFAKTIMDLGAKENIQITRIRDARRGAATRFYKTRLYGTIDRVIGIMKTDPDWEIRIGCARTLRYRRDAKALPPMKELLKIVPSQYLSTLKCLVKELEKDVRKGKKEKKKNPHRPW